MILCSIDLALTTTGLCIMDSSSLKVLHYCKISTKYGMISKQSETEKIRYIVDTIISTAISFKCKTIVVEDMFVSAIASKRTALILAKIRGALEYAASKNGFLIDSVSNSVIKKEICNLAKIKPSKSDAKQAVSLAVLNFYKGDKYIEAIGEYSDKQNKNKTSDIYDSIALGVVYAKRKHL